LTKKVVQISFFTGTMMAPKPQPLLLKEDKKRAISGKVLVELKRRLERLRGNTYGASMLL